MSLDRLAPAYSAVDAPDAHASAPCQTPTVVKNRTSNQKQNSKGSKMPTKESVDSGKKEPEDNIESYFHKLEHLLHQGHWKFIDNQSVNLQLLATEMRKGIANGLTMSFPSTGRRTPISAVDTASRAV